ncbi:MAG TPA: hypothetical protein VFL97_06820 [Nitrococcus sp.]|nr:hypothetical protein [Nitrococcus sp.]
MNADDDRLVDAIEQAADCLLECLGPLSAEPEAQSFAISALATALGERIKASPASARSLCLAAAYNTASAYAGVLPPASLPTPCAVCYSGSLQRLADAQHTGHLVGYCEHAECRYTIRAAEGRALAWTAAPLSESNAAEFRRWVAEPASGSAELH